MSTAAPVAADTTYEPEAATTPNFLVAAWRRWPWVLVGVFLGTAIGFLSLYLARPRVYQSSAQVLVVKKRSDVMSGTDSRMSFLEDYVATQVTLLRSERIMQAAAGKVKPDELETPGLRAMASDETSKAALMGYMTEMLAVAREKDATTQSGGTNILNLSFRGANARDCRYLLNTIIETYQKELATVYDTETERKIKEYDSLNKQFKAQSDLLEARKKEAVNQIALITPEEIVVIKARVSKGLESQRLLVAEKAELEAKLALIKDTGTDPRARALVLAQISDPGRGQVQVARNDVENPDAALKNLEYERAELAKKYTPEHPTMQSLEAKMAFLRDLSKRAGEAPAAPGKDPGKDAVPFDALEMHGKVLAFRLRGVDAQIKKATDDVNNDTKVLTTATAYQTLIDEATRKIGDLDKQMDANRVLKTQTEVTKSSGGYEATIINKPTLLDEPVAPKLSQALLLGAAGGLLLGLGLAALAELADKSFRSPAEIRAKLGVPVIGHIPPIRVGLPATALGVDVDPSVVVALRPKSVEAEAYRGVRTSLYFSLHGRGHQVIQVTSPNPGDGKSTLAANLAVSIAQSGKRVLLVDCDFRRPRQHKIFRLADPGPGFAAVITGETILSAAARPTAVDGLTVLPCGARPVNPAELLTSPAFAKAAEQARAQYDFVILDTPPILAVSDPSVVAPRADGVLLVFRMTSKARPQAERAREQLAQLGANVLGVIVNGAGRASDGYGYGSGAGYHYDYEYSYTDYTDNDPVDEDVVATLPKKG